MNKQENRMASMQITLDDDHKQTNIKIHEASIVEVGFMITQVIKWIAENEEIPENIKFATLVLVDKTIPKQAEKMEGPEIGFTHTCPSCGNYVGAIVYADGNKVGIDEYDYCPSCGQKLKWGQ